MGLPTHPTGDMLSVSLPPRPPPPPPPSLTHRAQGQCQHHLFTQAGPTLPPGRFHTCSAINLRGAALFSSAPVLGCPRRVRGGARDAAVAQRGDSHRGTDLHPTLVPCCRPSRCTAQRRPQRAREHTPRQAAQAVVRGRRLLRMPAHRRQHNCQHERRSQPLHHRDERCDRCTPRLRASSAVLVCARVHELFLGSWFLGPRGPGGVRLT